MFEYQPLGICETAVSVANGRKSAPATCLVVSKGTWGEISRMYVVTICQNKNENMYSMQLQGYLYNVKRRDLGNLAL